MKSKLTDALLNLVLCLCLIGLALLCRPETVEQAQATQTALLNLGEAALYFAGAFLLVSLAYWFKSKRNHEDVLTSASAQQLEFITRRFEQDFGQRSMHDPRGEAPVPAARRTTH